MPIRLNFEANVRATGERRDDRLRLRQLDGVQRFVVGAREELERRPEPGHRLFADLHAASHRGVGTAVGASGRDPVSPARQPET